VSQVTDLLKQVAAEYPLDDLGGFFQDMPRIAFYISLVTQALSAKEISELELLDLGGGIGLFSVGCAALGFKRVVLVDDFNDPDVKELGDSILDMHRRHGVEVIRRDVVKDGVADIGGTFDAVTSFDSIEHWHNSPKRLFQGAVDKLKPGGCFVLGAPNSVNLRKRLTVPFGSRRWSSMNDWYETSEFRGHVREPAVEDLWYIVRNLGLVHPRIYGRNWLGYYSGNPVIRALTRVFDYPLRLKPSLCSDIYVVGNKGA
jgi:SAM-dependent methyltransferase